MVLKNLQRVSPVVPSLIIIVNVPVPVFPPNPPKAIAVTKAPASVLVCSTSNLPPITASTPKFLKFHL